MTLQLAPLTSAILSLAWQTEPGVTYTIQTSIDLETWKTLPYVVEGTGYEESYYLENPGRPLFVSLQYDRDGDTDDNALPDFWEWQHFGYVGADPDADPDLDGSSTYVEWLNQTDPTDYYEGDWPIIHIACGRKWLVPAGNLSTQNIILSVSKASGEPWSHAPVYLTVESGNEGLVRITSDSMQSGSTLLAWTDSLGRIDGSLDSIHIVSPSIPDSIDEVTIRAGQSDAAIMIHSIGGTFGEPPRNLSKHINREGQSIYSWSGDPGDAEAFILQEKDKLGNWQSVIEIATDDLSPPDPVYGSYQLVLEN